MAFSTYQNPNQILVGGLVGPRISLRGKNLNYASLEQQQQQQKYKKNNGCVDF